MKIAATVKNERGRHRVALSTQGAAHAIDIATRDSGFGSKANGGELLCLALATCWCNDLYREAATRSIEVEGVQVEVEGEFGGAGEPAKGFTYRVSVRARAPEAAIRDLALHTDTVAEIQNTVRLGVPVALESIVAIPVT